MRIVDHPRSRGVYEERPPMAARQSGSSPLARGLQGGVVDVDVRPGIIPARAGFTPWPWPAASPAADHPRSRGVYAVALARSIACGGSSPLARGLLTRARPVLPGRRIIPARAGFTVGAVRRRGRREDHPRSRGVYPFSMALRRARDGSSPLARGLRSGTLRAPPNTADHPRSRGVYDLRVSTAPS